MKNIITIATILCAFVTYGSGLTKEMKISYTNDLSNASDSSFIINKFVEYYNLIDDKKDTEFLFGIALNLLIKDKNASYSLMQRCEDIGILELHDNIPATRYWIIYTLYKNKSPGVYLEKLIEAINIDNSVVICEALINEYIKLREYGKAIEVVMNNYQERYESLFIKHFKSAQFQKLIKSYLIRNNMAVVGETGKENIENIYRELFESIDAPLWLGIEDTLNKIGISTQEIDRAKAAEDGALVYKKILDMDLSPSNKAVYSHMNFYKGRQAWIDFIRIYNGE